MSMQEKLVSLARDLQAQTSSEDTLQGVVDGAVELVGPCESAGIFLARRNKEVETSVSTDTISDRAHDLQVECGEGPCIDAIWEHHVISVPDLATDDRWATWAPRAVEELGVRSMLCLRLFTHANRVGALNLFSTEVDAFEEDDIDTAIALAAHSAVAVAAATKIDHLNIALDSRTTIGQATGLVMSSFGVDSTGAINLLKRLSSMENRKLSAIAVDLVRQHNQTPRRDVAAHVQRLSPRA